MITKHYALVADTDLEEAVARLPRLATGNGCLLTPGMAPEGEDGEEPEARAR